MNNDKFGMPDKMVHGLGSGSVAGNNASAHPLELSEKTYQKRAEQLDFAMLRKNQGAHAPLKLQMEKRVLGKTGHLPFLPRSNASLESITGRDEQIGFDDFLGEKNFPERMGQPHAMVEKYCKY